MEELNTKPTGVRTGRIAEVDKHYYSVEFQGGNGLHFKLRGKRKKLNDVQKELLKVGRDVRIDCDENIIHFLGDDIKWY